MSEQEQKLAQLVAEKNDLEPLHTHPMATKLLQDGKDGVLSQLGLTRWRLHSDEAAALRQCGRCHR